MAVVLAGHGSGTDAPPSAGADSANSNGSGFEFAVLLPILNAGNVTKIYVKSADAVTSRRGAIYAYDGTTTLSAMARLSADITPPAAGAGAYSGWHVYTVSPGVDITGTNIWLAFLNPAGTYNYTDFNTSGGTTRDTQPVSTLAATHPTTTSSFTNRFNAFAEGTASGALPPPPDGVYRYTRLRPSRF